MTAYRQAIVLAGCVLAVASTLACGRAEAIEKVAERTEVAIVTQDGTIVRGKLVKVEPEAVTLVGSSGGRTTEIARTSITEVKRVGTGDTATEARPRTRELTVPDGTRLDVELGSSLASDTSRVEDSVTATVTSPIIIDDVTVIPEGSTLRGHVTRVEDSGKIKGRAELGFRFTRLKVGAVTYDVGTQPLWFRAKSERKDDAIKIGVGAAAGAIVGAITGGKKGAAIGTAVGAGGGTAIVLATEGDEIRLGSGRRLQVSLTEPLTMRLR